MNGFVRLEIEDRTGGKVFGNLFGGEEVLVSASGRLQGNITCPRVTLENGCRFKGSIDMESKPTGQEARPAREERPARDEKASRQNELHPAEPARA